MSNSDGKVAIPTGASAKYRSDSRNFRQVTAKPMGNRAKYLSEKKINRWESAISGGIQQYRWEIAPNTFRKNNKPMGKCNFRQVTWQNRSENRPSTSRKIKIPLGNLRQVSTKPMGKLSQIPNGRQSEFAAGQVKKPTMFENRNYLTSSPETACRCR